MKQMIPYHTNIQTISNSSFSSSYCRSIFPDCSSLLRSKPFGYDGNDRFTKAFNKSSFVCSLIAHFDCLVCHQLNSQLIHPLQSELYLLISFFMKICRETLPSASRNFALIPTRFIYDWTCDPYARITHPQFIEDASV